MQCPSPAHPGLVFICKAVWKEAGPSGTPPDPEVAIWCILHTHVTCMLHVHRGDVQQLLDHLSVGAVEGQPVHLHAHIARDAAPDSVPHQDAQHFLLLEQNEQSSSEGGGKRKYAHPYVEEER